MKWLKSIYKFFFPWTLEVAYRQVTSIEKRRQRDGSLRDREKSRWFTENRRFRSRTWLDWHLKRNPHLRVTSHGHDTDSHLVKAEDQLQRW